MPIQTNTHTLTLCSSFLPWPFTDATLTTCIARHEHIPHLNNQSSNTQIVMTNVHGTINSMTFVHLLCMQFTLHFISQAIQLPCRSFPQVLWCWVNFRFYRVVCDENRLCSTFHTKNMLCALYVAANAFSMSKWLRYSMWNMYAANFMMAHNSNHNGHKQYSTLKMLISWWGEMRTRTQWKSK